MDSDSKPGLHERLNSAGRCRVEKARANDADLLA
jgi:hypothetical protein